jgi:predicted methyltransferase
MRYGGFKMNQTDKNLEEFEKVQNELIEILKEESLERIEQKINTSTGKEKETWEWVKDAKIYYDSRCPNCEGQGIILNPDRKSKKFFVECPLCKGKRRK